MTKDLQRSLRLPPNHPRTRLWLAVAVAMSGDFCRDAEILPFATRNADEPRIQPVFRQ